MKVKVRNHQAGPRQRRGSVRSRKKFWFGALALVLALAYLSLRDRPEPPGTVPPIHAVMKASRLSERQSPVESIRFSPWAPVRGERIGAVVVGAESWNLLYHWEINSVLVGGNSADLTADLKRGDRITLTVVPTKGDEEGAPFSAETWVGNSPPVFVRAAESCRFDKHLRVFSCDIRAEDPDGDKLKYSLSQGPAGLSIDPQSGHVRWDVPADGQGSHLSTFTVKDGNGGEAQSSFRLTIN